jgi:DNA-binding GntR family transcriptional regulator
MTGGLDVAASPTLRLRSPSREGLADRAYEALKEALLFREIPPGTRLNLDHIARELGVSNTPVREALSQLEADGLVRKEPYRGYTALPELGDGVLDEMYEFRLLIEPRLAAAAARRRTDHEVRELQTSVDKFRAKPWRNDPEFLIAAANQDAALHTTIARIAGNRVASASIERLFHRMRPSSPAYARLNPTNRDQTNMVAEAWHEHELIVTAVGSREPERAATAMEAHLIAARRRATGVDSSVIPHALHRNVESPK